MRGVPLPPVDWSAVTRVRIDDFALRRGQTYGTMLMDADTGSVLDIVAGRSAEAADILRGDITAGLTGEEEAARDRVMSRAYYPRISGLLDRGESADEIARRHHYSRSAVAECVREWRRCAPEGIRALAERIVGGRSLRLLLSDPDHGAGRETGVVTGEAAAVDSV